MPNSPLKTFLIIILLKPLSFLLVLVLGIIGQNGKILSQVMVGREIGSGVIVDQSVISGLGLAPNIPDLLKERLKLQRDIQAFPLPPLLKFPKRIFHKNKIYSVPNVTTPKGEVKKSLQTIKKHVGVPTKAIEKQEYLPNSQKSSKPPTTENIKPKRRPHKKPSSSTKSVTRDKQSTPKLTVQKEVFPVKTGTRTGEKIQKTTEGAPTIETKISDIKRSGAQSKKKLSQSKKRSRMSSFSTKPPPEAPLPKLIIRPKLGTLTNTNNPLPINQIAVNESPNTGLEKNFQLKPFGTPPQALPLFGRTSPRVQNLKKEKSNQQLSSLGARNAPNERNIFGVIVFNKESTKLSKSAFAQLKKVVFKLKGEPQLRIQINAYAKALGKSKSELRRLSLSRALAVRSLFIEQGIKSSRIDVRALGGNSDSKPANQIKLLLLKN